MRFKILGHIEAEQDGSPIDIGSYKQRSLLALLLIHANQIVPTDRLIDDLWGDTGSRDKQNVLWVHVSNLRRALEPDRTRDQESILATRAPGYMLVVEPGSVDADEFENLLEEGRSLLPNDPAAASIVLSNALAMWRGPALEDFVYEDWAQPEIRRLTDLRLEAVEARIDADLARGMSSELVGELESLTLQNPLDEHLVGQLMLAQYRSGRQSDALRSYTSFRAHLGEELGIDPSPSLQQLEDRILISDSALLVSSVTDSGGLGPGLAIRGYELREEIGVGEVATSYRAYQPAVGREVLVKVAKPELANDPEFVRRFETRARSIASLEHPHILPLYDYWREPGAAYLVTPLMERGSLERRLERGALGEAEAEQVLRQVGGALAAAHRRGLVHGAVRPSNIMLDGEGNLYLGDFEVADSLPAHRTDDSFAAPEQRLGLPATAASDVYSLARVIRSATADEGPFPVVLERALSDDPSDRFEDGDALLAALEHPLHGGPAPETAPGSRNPYKGLHAFQQGDAEDFFGRERTVERLISRLGQPGSRGCFLTVVGPSGSGKTSVVKAGLVPALQRGALPGSKTWFVAEMVPAPHPLEELADALDAVATRSRPGLLDALLSGPAGLKDELPTLLPDDRSDLVLVVDQFEELFTQVDEDEASRFVASIVDAATATDSRLRVVITLRADFYDRPLSDPLLGELIRDSTFAITPMSPEELDRAIQGPARNVGVEFEQGLVGHLISDITERPGSLPLLQYTLTELFEKRVDDLIPTRAYHDIGGISASLANRADGVFRSLSAADRETTRQIFLHLVTLGEGGANTRRRVRLGEIADVVPASSLHRITDAFGRHRLLTFDRNSVSREPTVEITHEALLRDWPTLRRWLEESQDEVRLAQRLEMSAVEWADEGRDSGYLLHGPRLDQAEHFVDESSVHLSPLANELVETSSRARQQERQRRRRLRQRITVGFGIAAIVTSILAILALLGQREASDAAELARSKELALAAGSSEVVSQDPDLSLLLAIQSASIAEPSVESLAALHSAIGRQRAVFTYDWPQDQERWVVSGDINEDGSAMVAAATFGDYVEVVSTVTGERLWSKEYEDRYVTGAYFVDEGRQVIVGVAPDREASPMTQDQVGLFVFDAATGEQTHHQSMGTCGAYMLATSAGVADTRILVMGNTNTDCSARPVPDLDCPSALVFDLETRQLLDLDLSTCWGDGAISGDGTVVAMAVGTNRLAYRNAVNGEPLGSRNGGWEEFVALNEDGSQTITVSAEARGRAVGAFLHLGAASVFDSVTGEEIARFDGHGERPRGAIFHSAAMAYSVGPDGFVRGWDPNNGVEVLAVPGGLDPRAIAISGDGTHLIVFDSTSSARIVDLRPGAGVEIDRGSGSLFEPMEWGSDDGFVRVNVTDLYTGYRIFNESSPSFLDITVDTPLPLPSSGTTDPPGRFVFIPGTHRVLVAFANKMVLVDGDTLSVIAEREWGPEGPLPSELLVGSPDGRFVVGTSEYPYTRGGPPNIEVVDARTLERLLLIERAHAGTIADLKVSQTGDLIASGSRDEWVRVWSSSDGTLTHAMHAPGPVHGIAFSDDDRHLTVTLDDATTYEYTLDPDELLDIARSRLSRGFTTTECRTYGLDPCPGLEEMLQP